MVLIFPNICLWRRSLRSKLGGIDPEKLYRATLSSLPTCESAQEVKLEGSHHTISSRLKRNNYLLILLVKRLISEQML